MTHSGVPTLWEEAEGHIQRAAGRIGKSMDARR